ncbi:hypothetical protein GBAR_LOCUS30331, partial [Geodia barretti]
SWLFRSPYNNRLFFCTSCRDKKGNGNTLFVLLTTMAALPKPTISRLRFLEVSPSRNQLFL